MRRAAPFDGSAILAQMLLSRGMVSHQPNAFARAPQRAENSHKKWLSTAAEQAFTCSRCGKSGVRRSGPQALLAPLAREAGFRIYRCRFCHASYFEEV
ncbi:MAG TPA: hypothetical protein VGC79_35240 [Polyangiaceae bacterium]